MRKVSKGFWKIVKEVVIENYDVLITERLRQGYYIVREKLDALIGTKITKEDFEYFADSKSGAYNYYTQDMWTQLERKGHERPDAKPVGSLWVRHGSKYPIEDFFLVWNQARGFIFTEKSGEKLKDLTDFGWMIIEPEKGFPTRLIREKCKEDGRPVIAIHDADKSGEQIATSLGEKTTRTTHLDIAIDEVINLGLRWEDVENLNLPTQLEVKKHRKERNERCELESLAVLKARHGIENPFFDYVIIRMKQEGIELSPKPVKKKGLLKKAIISEITSKMEDLIEPVVERFVDGLDYDDDAVEVSIGECKLDVEGIEELIMNISGELEKFSEWKHEEDFEEEIKESISDKLQEMMEDA